MMAASSAAMRAPVCQRAARYSSAACLACRRRGGGASAAALRCKGIGAKGANGGKRMTLEFTRRQLLAAMAGAGIGASLPLRA